MTTTCSTVIASVVLGLVTPSTTLLAQVEICNVSGTAPQDRLGSAVAGVADLGFLGVQHPGRLGGVAMAGAPDSMRDYLEEYVESGANYYVCSFQWGSITHDQAMRSIQLFVDEVMPHYMDAPAMAVAE